MLLVEELSPQLPDKTNMARKDDHHIRIKNLRTGEEQGFMLTAGDKPFSVQ